MPTTKPGAKARRARSQAADVGQSGTFERVTVVPYEGLLDEPRGGSDHKGGPIWPDWDEQAWARHCRNGQPMDERPEAAASVVRHDGALAWGGPIVRHFGHQLADFSMRLLPTVLARPDLRIAFATKPGYGPETLAGDAGFWGQILDWFDISDERRVMLTRPTEVAELFVAAQGEQLNKPGPSEVHLDALDGHVHRRLGPAGPASRGTVFVSRAGQGWRFAGEPYIESALQGVGVEVMRPEEHPLVEQIRRYRSAADLIFSEGSAIHGLQLGGRIAASVTVLVRRPEFRIARASITPRVPRLEYREISAGLVHGLRPSGGPWKTVGISVPGEAQVIEAMAGCGIDLRPQWDSAAFAKSRDADVRQWVRDQRVRERRHDAAAIEHIVMTLRQAGLEHLVDESTRLLTRDPEAKAPAAAPARKATLPRPATKPDTAARRLNKLVDGLAARRYLEIGSSNLDTIAFVDCAERTAVGPTLPSTEVGPAQPQLLRSTTAAFLAELGPAVTFDLIFLKDAHIFEPAYRDLCASLLHGHARTALLVDNTEPSDAYSAERDRQRAYRLREAAGSNGREWHGDVFKLVFAIHDFHLGIDYRTIIRSGTTQTLLWRNAAAARTPAFERFEDVSNLSYLDMSDHRDLLQVATEDEAIAECLAALDAVRA